MGSGPTEESPVRKGMRFLNAGSSAQHAVKPNRNVSLEQRRVDFRAKQGEQVAGAPSSLKGFSKAFFKARRGRVWLVGANFRVSESFVLASVHVVGSQLLLESSSRRRVTVCAAGVYLRVDGKAHSLKDESPEMGSPAYFRLWATFLKQKKTKYKK